jgi:hypothetical protein
MNEWMNKWMNEMYLFGRWAWQRIFCQIILSNEKHNYHLVSWQFKYVILLGYAISAGNSIISMIISAYSSRFHANMLFQSIRKRYIIFINMQNILGFSIFKLAWIFINSEMKLCIRWRMNAFIQDSFKTIVSVNVSELQNRKGIVTWPLVSTYLIHKQ